MPLNCNIDTKGRVARLIYGLFLIGAAVLVGAFWAWPAGDWRPWTVVAILAASGAFAVFEARAGWCVIRAMGIRTPI